MLTQILVMVTVDLTTNTTYTFGKLSIWGDLQTHVGLWVACFPSLQPLLRRVRQTLRLSTTNGNNNYPLPSIHAASKSTTWRRRSQGYIEHHAEARDGGGDISDDSSRKNILRYNPQEFVEVELGNVSVISGRGAEEGFNSSKGMSKTVDIEIRASWQILFNYNPRALTAYLQYSTLSSGMKSLSVCACFL